MSLKLARLFSLIVGVFALLMLLPPENSLARDAMSMSRSAKQKIWKSKPAGDLSRNKCQTWESTTENTADTENFTVQMVYAYAADKPNRFRRFANMIQRDAQLIDWLFVSQSRGRNRVAWDKGGSCGERYLDIRTVKLPHNWAWYQRKRDTVTIAEHIRGAVVDQLLADGSLEKWGPGLVQKHYFTYADKMAGPKARGASAMAWNSDDARPGLDSEQISHDGFGFILGTPKSRTFSGSGNFNSLLLRRYAVAHEIVHLLGAVSPEAPNYGHGGHCSDGWDLMCDNGGRGLFRRCRGWAFRIDCGKNDYFNPFQDKPSSWLSQHWNLADSPYLYGKLRQPAIDDYTDSQKTSQLRRSSLDSDPVILTDS